MLTHQEITEIVIPQKLRDIEEKEGVKVLFCVESGSRAWGFASPDSDYDVRFIYLRRQEDYLRLDQARDVIEWQLDETLDINGWDLMKALRLLHKSNPSLFEWLRSPIVYKTTPDWERVRAVAGRYFQPKLGLYHYLSMAKNNDREYMNGDEVRLKKYFYILRPLLACRWILEKKSPPPVLFSELKEACLDPSVVPAVDTLLKKKTEASELGTGRRDPRLSEYIASSFSELEAHLEAYPASAPLPWAELNDLFRSLVSQEDDALIDRAADAVLADYRASFLELAK